MSILLSIYFPEGIVFAADKNITITEIKKTGETRYVEPTGTKVLSWPSRKAIIGYVGLASLAGLPLDEWLRIFIANTRDFTDIEQLASQMRNQIQNDFSEEYQSKEEVHDKQIIIHLGGFTEKGGIYVPVMYHIWNYKGDIDPQTGEYPPGELTFNLNEDIESDFKSWPKPEDYPGRVRDRLQNMVDQRRYLWYCNGYNLGAFLVFRDTLWNALGIIQDHGFSQETFGIHARVAFCQMAVELFGLYFTHYHAPADRFVGGGSDAVYIPWPNNN